MSSCPDGSQPADCSTADLCLGAVCPVLPAANCSTDPCNDCHRKWSYYESDITTVCDGKLYGNMWSMDYYF